MICRRFALAGASALALLLGACGGGDGGIGGSGATQGTLRVALTDAPSCGYDAVNVTVTKVRVHRLATAADADPGWSEIVLSPALRVDLLTLSNGVLKDLGQTPLPAASYTQLRLVLADNSAADPLANSVVPTSGTETALDTPSAQQTGLKLNVAIDVPANKVADVVLDFDACKSVVKRGASGKYNLKPVVTAVPRLSDAGLRVVGWVDPAIALGSTSVSLQAGGVPVKATTPDQVTGQFVLYPVPVGNYSLVVRADGHVTAVMTGVPVIDTAITQANPVTLPILPRLLTAAPRGVTGTVTSPATPSTASVRATQTFTGGATVEVAWTSVNPDTGGYSLTLPVDAPQRTAWVNTPGSLNFVDDTAAAGLYTLQASLAGVTKPQTIDTKAVVPPVNFTFP